MMFSWLFIWFWLFKSRVTQKGVDFKALKRKCVDNWKSNVGAEESSSPSTRNIEDDYRKVFLIYTMWANDFQSALAKISNHEKKSAYVAAIRRFGIDYEMKEEDLLMDTISVDRFILCHIDKYIQCRCGFIQAAIEMKFKGVPTLRNIPEGFLGLFLFGGARYFGSLVDQREFSAFLMAECFVFYLSLAKVFGTEVDLVTIHQYIMDGFKSTIIDKNATAMKEYGLIDANGNYIFYVLLDFFMLLKDQKLKKIVEEYIKQHFGSFIEVLRWLKVEMSKHQELQEFAAEIPDNDIVLPASHTPGMIKPSFNASPELTAAVADF